MSDLEDQLRAAVGRKSADYEPSADLPARIDARVRRHRLRRQLLAGSLVSVAAAAVTLVVLLAGERSDDDSIRMIDEPTTQAPRTSVTASSTSTTSETTTSTTSGSTTSSTTAPTGQGPSGGDYLAQSREGIGDITVGMTVREAQDASGLALNPAPVGGGSCLEAPVRAIDGTVLVIQATGTDPMDGVVRAVAGSVLPTIDAVQTGQTRAEVVAILGQPTRVEPGPADLGGEVLVSEQDGYAYGVLVVDDLVLGVQSGDPDWVTDSDGCPD